MNGQRRRIAGLIAVVVVASLAGPAAAEAADCTLSGSGQEGPTDTSFYQAPDATLEASMLFVEFPGDPAVGGETPPETTIGPQLRTWAASYLSDVSFGDTALDVQFDNQWLPMSKPANQYTFQTFAGQREFMAEAATLADTAGFDFSGRRTLYVVAAPTGGDLGNSPAFIAFSNEAIVKDGTSIRWGSSLGDDSHIATNNYGSHVLAHETGHTFGLPDLYSYGEPFATAHLNAGAWDLMGWIGPGLGFNGWHRQKLGWLDPAQAVCVDGEATATLSPLASPGGTKMLVSKTSASTAYVAEVRTPVGVDSAMCHPGGVLIYEVDANAASGGAADNGPIFVELAEPGNPGDPNDSACGALQNAPFEPGENFTAGAVTVQVLSGSPAAGYQVRMTGPATPTDPGPADPTDPTGPTGPAAGARTGGIEKKLRLDGKKRVIAALTCPAGASACTGTVRLSLSNGKQLASGGYSVAPPGGDVPLKLGRKARKALKKAFGKKDKTKATALLDGADGKVTQKVKLLR
jgi:M6 family metalloprotease-like protein